MIFFLVSYFPYFSFLLYSILLLMILLLFCSTIFIKLFFSSSWYDSLLIIYLYCFISKDILVYFWKDMSDNWKLQSCLFKSIEKFSFFPQENMMNTQNSIFEWNFDLPILSIVRLWYLFTFRHKIHFFPLNYTHIDRKILITPILL